MTESYKYLAIFIGVVLVLFAAVTAYLYLYTDTFKTSSQLVPAELINAVRTGQYEKALEMNEAVQSDSSKSKDEKARTLFATLGSEYRVTGDVSSRLSDIAAIKAVLADQDVSPWIRVDLLNVLAGQYAISAGDPTVNAAIYSEPPYSRYYEEAGDSDRTARLSSKNLFEWSYGLWPTSFAAIQLAKWYSEQVAFDPDLPRETVRSYQDTAADYVAKADRAAAKEDLQDPTFRSSTRYLVYKYWRAVVVGRLSTAKTELGAAHRELYKSEYDSFIELTQSIQNPLAHEYRLYARMFYARALSVNGSVAEASEQLDLLAQEIDAIQDRDINVFLRFLRNEYAARPKGATWMNLIEGQYANSTAFKAAIARVINQ